MITSGGLLAMLVEDVYICWEGICDLGKGEECGKG